MKRFIHILAGIGLMLVITLVCGALTVGALLLQSGIGNILAVGGAIAWCIGLVWAIGVLFDLFDNPLTKKENRFPTDTKK